MIDPITSLASSIVASPGVYALLLGSGVSRAAGIPTGWEVTIDLIRRIAAGEGEDDIATASATDVEEWFRERFKEEASYSNVLEHLALGPGDRRNLLSSYFERGPDDAEGFKTPTRAHHAIASLVASGYIKVIVTTNFDRLLEDALAAKGVRAQVIFSPDHIRGATPLEHAKVTILKLHGDYQDNRIRNTVDELDAYEPKLEKYLRGILEDYGLLVCGWSGDWDRALVRVLQKTVSRRYGFYMTFRSTPSAIANELIEFRGGRLIEIEDADTFFAALEEKVLSIEKLGRRDPISADLAQISLKRYLPRPELGIELEELVRTHLNDLRDRHAQWRGQGNALDAYLEELE